MAIRDVLLLHYTFPGVAGGVEMVMARHAAALRDAGARVQIAAGRGPIGVRGVRGSRIAELDSRHPAVQRVFRALAAGTVPPDYAGLRDRLVVRLRPLLRDTGRTVAHNVATLHKNHALAAALHALGPELAPGQLIVWVHDLAWANPQYASERHAGDPWQLLARPIPGARYVAVSEQRRDEAAVLLGVARDQVLVVPNGVDTDPLLRLSPPGRRLADRLGLRDAYPVLLLPARLTRRKRIEVAIEAAVDLRARGFRPTLVVTGSPGPHNPANAAYLAELRVRARRARGAAVLLHDVVGRAVPYRVVADLYGLADVLVFPSESEGFGIPILEAAISRTPIVCSDIPAHRAIAGDDATYVAPDAPPLVLADAVERVLETDRGARLRKRAIAGYEWEDVLRDRVLPLILEPSRKRRSA
jgi:glycosyltransferase involved in cell wall biosynthesis